MPSLRNALRHTLNLDVLHKRLWWNDPDCLLVRDTNTRLTEPEVMSAITLVGLSGGMLAFNRGCTGPGVTGLAVGEAPLHVSNVMLLCNKCNKTARVGYQVALASTGEEALSMAQEHRPDLVLLDMHLPDISGIEVIEQLEADLGLPVVSCNQAILWWLGDALGLSGLPPFGRLGRHR